MRKSRSRRLVHIGDILSITSGRLVAREGFSSFHRALTYMAGEDVTYIKSCVSWMRHDQFCWKGIPCWRTRYRRTISMRQRSASG